MVSMLALSGVDRGFDQVKPKTIKHKIIITPPLKSQTKAILAKHFSFLCIFHSKSRLFNSASKNSLQYFNLIQNTPSNFSFNLKIKYW